MRNVIASIVTVMGLTALIASIPTVASAQYVGRAILREGEQLAGADPGQIITGISNTAVNHQRGYAALLLTSDGLTSLHHVWGDPDGDGPDPSGIVRTESTIGTLEQTSYEGFFGYSTAVNDACYSAICTDTDTGTSGLDSAWRGGTPIAVEGQPYPNEAGNFWIFGSRPGSFADGTLTFVGGFSTSPTGPTQNRGLYVGDAATPVLVGGDMVPLIPAPLDPAGPVSFDYRFSASGTNYLTEVTAGGNAYMVMNGVGLELVTLVGEGLPIPAEIGGLVGESWDNFDFVGITEDGHFFFSGDSDADVSMDEFVVVDGGILLREGDATLDGDVLTGAIEGGYMNEDGDVALIWDIEDGGGGSLEALIVNGHVYVTEGDEIDFDGDGAVDAGTRLDNFTGISSLTMTDRLSFETAYCYVTADVEVPVALARPVPPSDQPAATGEAAGIETGTPPVWADTRVSADAAPRGSTRAAGTVIVEVVLEVEVPVAGLAVGSGGDPSPVVQLSLGANPSRSGATDVALTLGIPARVEVTVIDASGRRVRELADAELGAGAHTIVWDHRDLAGRTVAPGAYWIVVESSGTRRAERLTVLR